jgi:hypothetical protein
MQTFATMAERPPPANWRPMHAARDGARNAVLIVSGVSAVVAACVVTMVWAAASPAVKYQEAAPAIPVAEETCRAAFQAEYEREQAETRDRYTREEPTFFYRTSMDKVHVWDSRTVGNTVVVGGDVQWTLTTGVLGAQAQTTKFTCTATTRNGSIVTSVN